MFIIVSLLPHALGIHMAARGPHGARVL
jgi:hypothetical protein